MNVRQANVVMIEGRVVLHLAMGEATVPVPLRVALEPRAALALAGQIEAAVHRWHREQGELPFTDQ